MSDKNNDSKPASVTEPWYKRRKPRRNAIIIATVLVVLTLLYSFVPTYTARFVIASQLNKFGIEHTGVETLKINPWTMEVWLGPVNFRTGDTDPGQLGELGVKVNPFAVFQKHAMVERVLVRGIDINVVRADDNSITLNGIPLQQFFPAKDETSPEQPEEESTPWGTGLGSFEMQDSRFIYKEKTGGTLTVQIESLLLGEFISWTPDEPGTFQLKGSVNDIEFDWEGQARPFAEQITVTATADTRQAELPKIVEFTGPLGGNPLERQAGVYNSQLQHEITLFATGRLEGKSVGKLEVIGADYAQDEIFGLVVERAEIDLDTAYTLTEENDIEVDGQVSLEVKKTDAKMPKDNAFGLDKARVELVDLSASVKDDRSISVAVKPQINLTNGNFSGRIQLSMDALLDVLRQLQSLSAGVAVSKEQTGLGDFAGGEVTLPKSNISVAQLNTSSPKLELTTAAGKVTLDHSFSSEATGLEISTGERNTTIAAASNNISNLQLQSGEGRLSLNLSEKTVLNDSQAKGPAGEIKINSIESVTENLDLEVESGNIVVTGSSSTAVKGSHFLVYKTEELPQTSIGIGAVTTNVKKGSFAVAQQQMQWQGDAEASIDNVVVNVAKGKVAFTKFRRLELRGAGAENLNIKTDALTVSGLDVFVTRKFIDGLTTGKKDQAAPQEQEQEQETGTTIVKVSPELAKKIQQKLTDLGYAPGAIDGQPGPKTQAAIREFEQNARLPVTGQPSEELLAALETGKPRPAKPEKMQLQLGRFALVKGARVRFQDDKVQPAVQVNTIFKTVELRDVDTMNPKKRARATLLASINEFTNVELKGWASNLGPNANLDIKGKIENLELPPYSPYAAEFGGVYLEKGQFSTSSEATAQQGNLEGAIKLDVKSLVFKPLSEEDAKRLSETAGFPIQTAVGLLQDSKGHINLNFPVAGTITEPDVDISSAISKAIGGTLKNVFPPTMIAGMMSSKKEGGGVTFEPIKFKPGSTELDAAARKYVNELAALLQERPILSLNVCGATNAEDFFELTLIKINKPTKTQAAVDQRLKLIETHKPKLLELAGERTKVVRRYMITEKGLDAKRVGECRPKFDVDDKGPPRVDVTL